MRGRTWTWAVVVAAVVAMGVAVAAADDGEQPTVMRIDLEEGTAPDGRTVAIRVRTDGGGQGTCGERGGVEFKKVGEAMASETVPVVFETEGLDCEVEVSWGGERGGWGIRVRGGQVQAAKPAAAPADTQEPSGAAEAEHRS